MNTPKPTRQSWQQCDPSGRRSHHPDLETEILAATARRLLDEDLDARSLRFSARDLTRIYPYLCEDDVRSVDRLRAARGHWAMADLAAAAGQSSVTVERDANATVPGNVMSRAHDSRAHDGCGSLDSDPAASTQEATVVRDGAATVARLRDAAFAQIRRAVDEATRPAMADPRLALGPGEEAVAEAPVRLDLAGGWSDTPPYSLERGGAVLNVAALLDGRRPVSARVRPLPEPVLRLRALDLDRAVAISRRSEALRYADPQDPFALHKAAIVMLGIVTPDGGPLRRQLERLGGGLEVSTESAVPRGSGLGTSSILGGVLLAALGRAIGLDLDALALFDLVLDLEQRLTTGGGWQDQIGGLLGGWKVTRTRPGLRQVPRIERLQLDPAVRQAVRDRAFLLYSGYTRLARNILRHVVGQYLSRDAGALEVLQGMPRRVDEMAASLAAGDLNAVGAAMDWNNQAVIRLDPQSWPAPIARITDAIRPHLSGAKPAGAGGGGFLIFMAKSREDRLRAEARLHGLDLPPGARTYSLEVAEDGLLTAVRRCAAL